MRFNIIRLVAIIILVVSAPALAQLTQQDIDALRERGKQEGWTFTVGLCEANSTYSLEQLCGFKDSDNPSNPASSTPFTSTMVPPDRWDWRDLGGVTPVKNQGGCGSCWAFATVGVLESVIRIRDGITVDLSEQWLVSCNTHYVDDWGCGGGNFAHDYHLARHDACGQSGAVYEAHFPYVGWDAPCGCTYPHDFWIDGWDYVDPNRPVPVADDIKQAVMEFGPVAVACFVNNAWFAYSGGVFNNCEVDDPNHTVLIVGWDEDYMGESVWIVKNSWGTDWGEDGYMYIPYNCCRIGYTANYVEYNLPGFYYWADSTFGWAPMDVNFDAFSSVTVDNWTWDFGNGDSAFVQTPATHTYLEPGIYDVSLQIDVGGEQRTLYKPNYIVAVADTVRGATVMAAPDTQVEVVLTANNTIPVQYFKIPVEFLNDFNMVLDSISTVGCRTDYFEIQTTLDYDPWFSRLTLKLVSSLSGTSPDLEAGKGPIARLYFAIPGSATEGQSAQIGLDGYNAYLPHYYGENADYEPATADGQVQVSTSCCLNCGDINHSGGVDLEDVTYMVDWTFQAGLGPVCDDEAEVDGVAPVNIEDLVYLIEYVFNGGPAPALCP